MTDTLPERLRVAHGNSFARRLFLEAAAEIKALSLTAQIAEKHALETGAALDAMTAEVERLNQEQCADPYWSEDGHHRLCWDVTHALSAAKAEKARAEAAEDECERLLHALALVLPMAKGYAAKNKVGSNQEYITNAEDILAETNND